MNQTLIDMVHWFIDPFFEGTPVKDAGKRYKDRVDETRKKREDRLEAQRKRNRKKIKEAAQGLWNLVQEDASTYLSDQFTIEQFALSLGPIGRASYAGYELAEFVADELSTYALKEGVIGALDLYTPEIQRYEETALVGLGGMII